MEFTELALRAQERGSNEPFEVHLNHPNDREGDRLAPRNRALVAKVLVAGYETIATQGLSTSPRYPNLAAYLTNDTYNCGVLRESWETGRLHKIPAPIPAYGGEHHGLRLIWMYGLGDFNPDPDHMNLMLAYLHHPERYAEYVRKTAETTLIFLRALGFGEEGKTLKSAAQRMFSPSLGRYLYHPYGTQQPHFNRYRLRQKTDPTLVAEMNCGSVKGELSPIFGFDLMQVAF